MVENLHLLATQAGILVYLYSQRRLVAGLPFYNQMASLNATPDFTPDGKQIVYASSASGYAQIYVANLDGSNLRRDLLVARHRRGAQSESENRNSILYCFRPNRSAADFP